MSRGRSIVKFSEKLSILSAESIQTGEKIDTPNEIKQTRKERIEEEEEEDDDSFKGNEDSPPIRVEYTTKRDSTEMNRCLVTPKPPRKHVPVFWKRGTDSVNIGYTLKTNFIGDTKIMSVAPTGTQEQFDEFDDFLFRNYFIERSMETFRRGTDVSSNTQSTKKESLIKYVNKSIEIDKQDHLENLEVSKRKFLRKQLMNESYPAPFKKFLISDRNRDEKSTVNKEDSEDNQINVYNGVATEYPKYTGPSQGPVVKTIKDNRQSINIEDNNKPQEVDDKLKDNIPLEKKLIQLLQNTNPESKLIHRRVPFKETRKLQFIQKNETEPPGSNKLLVERQEFVSPINNDNYPKRGILTHQKPLDQLKVPPSLSTIRKLPSGSILPQNETNLNVRKLVTALHGVKSEVNQKPEESVLTFPTKIQTGIDTFVINQTKNNEDFSFNNKKDIIVTNTLNKPSPFPIDRFVVDDSNTFLKRPVQFSLKIIRNNDGNSDYKIIAKKNLGLKDEYNMFMKQFKLPKGLQQLPQIVAPKNVAAFDEGLNENLEIEEEHQENVFSKSNEVLTKLKLPYLNTPFSKSDTHQNKKNASRVISHSESSPSLLKFDKSKSLVKIDRKLKLKEQLSLQSNLSRLNQMKEQISSSSRRELIEPDEIKISKSGTKLSSFSDSHFIENVETFTKESVALLGKSYEVNETKHQPINANNKQDDLNNSPKNKLNILDESDVQVSSTRAIEEEILSVNHIVEKAPLEEPSAPSGAKSEGEYISDHAEEEDMPTSYTSTTSSDILMKIDSESLQNMVKEYLMSNFTYGEEEMEMEDKTKYSEDKISVHQEEHLQKETFDYTYRGTYDVHNLRSGFGCLHWDASESRTYCGFFLYNSLHGKGHYFIKEDKCLNFYNGHLYGNELYGYGQIVYDNAEKFEGLFKNNSRYGPGVFTHKNGTQDVGLWYGNSLLRINVDLSRCIPSFGKTLFGKIKLLNFRRTIRLKTYNREKAREILENLTSDAKILARYKELYNPYVRNGNSLFFNRSDYDSEFFRTEECYVSIFKSLKRHKTISDGFPTQTTQENETKISEEQAELIKTIENVQTKLNNFRTQIDELHTKQEIELAMYGSVTSPTTTLDDAQKNKLYKEELFYNSVLEFLNYKLGRYDQVSNSGLSTMDQKVRVNSLLAWNNNEILLDMLLHTFRCRSSEENVSFEVKPIIRGERKKFGHVGENEEHCIEFLENCQKGDDKKALNLLFKSNINPDVCDSRGNTGLHLATCLDHVNIIKILANNGANLNSTNDEGLIPLSLALLRYLEIIYNVRRWEFGFLSEHEVSFNEKRQFSEWIPYESFWISILRTPVNNRRSLFSSDSATSHNVRDNANSKELRLNSRSAPKPFLKMNQMKFFKDLIPEFADDFVFSLEYKRKLSKSISSSTSNSRSNQSVQKKQGGKLKQEKILPPKEIKRRLEKISQSIEVLLHHGAELIDAMPFPPFFMALFTKSPRIVESFLKRNADPNRLYQGMTPLQIVCCLEPSDELCDVVDMLIQYEADVNVLSDPSVWRECDNDLLRYNVTSYDVKTNGKNALHFICLREDVTEYGNTFLCRITEILFQARIRTGFLYQGHSYLSMAVLKGNTDLIRCLSKFIDVRRSLGYGLGNALTVLALRRYPYMIPFHMCKEVIDCLFDLGISPFESLYNYYNIFEFLDDEWPPSIGEELKSWNAYVTHIKRYQSLIKQASFTHIHTNCNTISKIYIREKSRSILDVIIRYKAVMYLYNFFREMLVNKHTAHLATMIGSSNEASNNLEVIFLCGKLPQSWFTDDIVTRLCEYVDEVNKRPKNEEIKHNIRFDNRKRKSKYIFDSLELYPIAQWVSDENLYKCEVCYFCMHKKYKVLLKCPLCGIVKFCSKRCNYLSKKFQTIHACPTLFYQDVFKDNQLFIDKNEPIPLYGIDLDFENARKR